MRPKVLFQRLLLLSLLALPAALSQINIGHSAGTSQLLTYQTNGPPAPISLQRISDSSFETGIQPSTESDFKNPLRTRQRPNPTNQSNQRRLPPSKWDELQWLDNSRQKRRL